MYEKLSGLTIDALDLKETKVLCADKGYDSDLLRTKIEDT